MIEFKDLNYRDSAIIYHTTLEQIKKIYDKSPLQAGELAIAAIEVALSGEHSSDDYVIDVILEQAKFLSTKNKESHDKAVDAKKEARIEKLQLREIIDYLNIGHNQTQIAKLLNTTKQNISKRITIIRTEFPELLSTNLVDEELSVDNLTTSQQSQLSQLVDEMDNLTTESTDLTTEVDCQLKNSRQFDNQVNQVNRNVNVNDNVNDNVNVSRTLCESGQSPEPQNKSMTVEEYKAMWGIK